MKHYSIGFGYFLLFKYKGNSHFHLHIFDLTTTEIDYTKCYRQQLQTHHAKTIKVEDDEPFPEVYVVDHQQTREDGCVSSTRKAFNAFPARKMKNQQSNSSKRYKFSMIDENVRNHSKRHLVKNVSTWNQKAERKKGNPFFPLQMTEYNMIRYTMFLPMKFTKENMRDYAEYFELQDSDDPTRRWLVECRRYGFQWSLAKGWSDFVKDKRLQEGDECVLEIIARGIIIVSVFHANGEGDGNQSPCRPMKFRRRSSNSI